MTRTWLSSVAVIAPMVISGVAGAASPRFLTSSTALLAARAAPVVAVAPVEDARSGPAVVAVADARTPTALHVVATLPGPAPLPTQAMKPVGALGIPAMALSAYQNAERTMAASDPGCGISWNLLAGIGRIESMHANGGATDSRGTAIQPIYGPALDGALPGNEVVVQGSSVGHVTYARAMGPMQFLPGTWARYVSDGDGDGVADPQNLYDSTLAAARYLCSGGLNLRDQSQVMTAILRYNNSVPYAHNVLGWSEAYAAGVVPVDLPPLIGPAPPLGDSHDEHPEGIGPGLPLNIHGLAPTDPLAQMPLIDFGPPGPAHQSPTWPIQSPTPGARDCTVICIGQ